MKKGEDEMRNVRFIFVCLMLFGFLGGCSNEQTASNVTIDEAELSKREEDIFSIVAENSFVFEFKGSAAFKEVEVWVEKYEFGKKKKDVNHLISNVNKDGSIIFAISKEVEENEESVFYVGITGEEGTFSVSNSEQIREEGKENTANTRETNPLLTEGTVEAKEGIALAAISYKSGEGGMSTLSTDFFSDVEGNSNEINDLDKVYVLKAKFSK